METIGKKIRREKALNHFKITQTQPKPRKPTPNPPRALLNMVKNPPKPKKALKSTPGKPTLVPGAAREARGSKSGGEDTDLEEAGLGLRS